MMAGAIDGLIMNGGEVHVYFVFIVVKVKGGWGKTSK
jgi:hypothetical protein